MNISEQFKTYHDYIQYIASNTFDGEHNNYEQWQVEREPNFSPSVHLAF